MIYYHKHKKYNSLSDACHLVGSSINTVIKGKGY